MNSHSSDPTSLRESALAIWKRGVAAVDSTHLVENAVSVHDGLLQVCNHSFPLAGLDRIVVLGAGKAGAGMARGLEQSLPQPLLEQKLTGWLNVPADCVTPLQKIHLHAARLPHVNEPTAEGVQGTDEILKLARSLGPKDLCIVLISGGGSALLPAPIPEITLPDKLAVTKCLMKRGANIQELNAVRTILSRVKGGGLARAATGARAIITLIISDVVGDPLDVIASGPTVNTPRSPARALEILNRFDPRAELVPPSVWQALRHLHSPQHAHPDNAADPKFPPVANHVIGSNALALSACALEARARGFEVRSLGSQNTGIAHEQGTLLADLALQARSAPDANNPICILSGGEPVVQLAHPAGSGKGGRNQELILAALNHLWNDDMHGLCLLSGGTDGEDGPTDAAGALIDADLLRRAKQLGLHPLPFLEANNSYPFFDMTGGLIRTGPTHTNVMDLRIALIERDR